MRERSERQWLSPGGTRERSERQRLSER